MEGNKRQKTIDYKRALLQLKKCTKQKAMKYNGLTRRIREIWSQQPTSCCGNSRASRAVKKWCGYDDAIAHGNAVDVQLSAYVKLGYEAFIKQRGSRTVDPCTLAIIKMFKDRGWTPLLSQYILYDSETRVKTHLDVLATDENGELVLIELKATLCGDDSSYCAAKTADVLQLSGGFTLPNSYYHRNMIQLVMMLEMLYRRYGFLARRAYIVRVGGGNLWLYPIDAAVLRYHNHVYNTFIEAAANQHGVS